MLRLAPLCTPTVPLTICGVDIPSDQFDWSGTIIRVGSFIFFLLALTTISLLSLWIRDLQTHLAFDSGLLLDNAPLSHWWLMTEFCHFLQTKLSTFAHNIHGLLTLLQLGLPDHRTVRSQFRTPSRVQRSIWILVTVLLCLNFNFSSEWGEGSVTDTGDGRGMTSVIPKTRVEEPRHTVEFPQTRQPKTSTTKRSYKRAIRRIRTHGYTWYRNKFFTASDMGITLNRLQPSPTAPNMQTPKSQHRQRLICLSWNCGGLPVAHYDMLLMWAAQQPINIIFLQETHWGHTNEWLTDHYYIIHSGVSYKQAGLMCMISKKTCPIHDISWREIDPGRLLHIRIHGKTRCTDLINVYQYTSNSVNNDKRETFWHKLHELLSSLPQRNTLFLAGDMNTTADVRSNAIGLATYAWEGRRLKGTNHADSDHWQQIMRQHDLCALNTWDNRHGPTYQFSHQHSRIDFLCCRRVHSDHTSKQVQQLRDFALLPLDGAFHVPLLTSIRKQWNPDAQQKHLGWTRQQRLELHGHYLQQDETIQNLQYQIHSRVQNLNTDIPRALQALHDELGMIDNKAFQKTKQQTTRFPDQRPFHRFLTHTASLRQIRRTDQRSILQAWFHIQQRCKARREMSILSKQTRKRRVAQVFEKAQQADQAKDHFTLFQAIREIAPKQHMRRIMLRDIQGRLLGPAASADLPFNNGTRPCTQILPVLLHQNPLHGHSQLMILPEVFMLCPPTRHWLHPMHQRRSGSVELKVLLNTLMHTCTTAATVPAFLQAGAKVH